MAKAQRQTHEENEVSEVATDRFLQFTISGSYYNSKKEIIDFDGVIGKIPMCDEEQGVGSMHVRGRFAERWVKAEKDEDGKQKYPERISKLRQVFIDDVCETTGTLSFVGKDIKKLTMEEMQELAVAKDIRGIPLPSAGLSLRDMLTKTYLSYAEVILNKKIKEDDKFNFAKLPSITLNADGRFNDEGKITNEEMIELEQRPAKTEYGVRDNPKSRFSLEELKKVAADRNIAFEEGISFDELYAKLFNG